MFAYTVVLFLIAGAVALAETPASIGLPKPDTQGGKPLMQVLNARKSSREFTSRALTPQVLSNLLWAAYGINRPDGRRTAPSAMNHQTIDVYVVLPDGAYIYNAKSNNLTPVASGDLRATTGTQDFVAEAALNLVYVADYAKLGDSRASDKLLYTGSEAGFIGQNVYLYCASEGLGTVIRASINREALAKALHLRPDQQIVLAQTVGYTK